MPADEPPAASRPARHLRVRVTEEGRHKVDLTLPAGAAGHLSDLMPGDLGEKLRDRGVDVGGIAISAAERGFPPGELFAMIDGAKQVRVWLE